MDKFISVIREKREDGSVCSGVINETLCQRKDGETDQDYMDRVLWQTNDIYINVSIVQPENIPYVNHYDLKDRELVFNPAKYQTDTNKKIDIEIKEIENGFPRVFRDLVLSNKVGLDPIGVKKVQDAEDKIKVLREKRIK